MSTFTWVPDIGAKCDRKPSIRSVKFGEGYEQRAANGLNPDLRTYTLTFTGRSAAESTAIDAFLTTQGGVTSFDYTHPGESSRKFVCREWSSTDAGYQVKTISATFMQVPL
jgi:phage-related protein